MYIRYNFSISIFGSSQCTYVHTQYVIRSYIFIIYFLSWSTLLSYHRLHSHTISCQYPWRNMNTAEQHLRGDAVDLLSRLIVSAWCTDPFWEAQVTLLVEKDGNVVVSFTTYQTVLFHSQERDKGKCSRSCQIIDHSVSTH